MTVDVSNETTDDVDLRALSELARFALDQLRIHPRSEMAIRLVDEPTMAEYNAKWMDADGPTDVLAFPMDELRPGRDGADLPEGLVGDVLLCPAVAARQAVEAGHRTADELAMLTVHGLLHLLGFDHAEPAEEKEMFALQGRLLEQWQETPR